MEVDSAAIKAADIHVLIVDNEAAHARTVAESLERVGFQCAIATSGTQGVERMGNESFDVVITDLRMPDIDGLELLKRAKQLLPQAEVILATGHGTVASAVAAMQQGAFNYLQKPLDLAQLRVVAEKAAEAARLRRTNEELHRRLDEKFGFEGVVGSSPQMNAVIERLRRIAPTDASVLITGRNGHRQGIGRAGDPSEQSTEEQAVCGAELRGAERKHFGKRAVRAREGGVYGCLDGSGGQV